MLALLFSLPRSIGLSYKYNEGVTHKNGGIIMELTKELKEKLENAESKEEAKKILEESGVELTDEELDQVAGGQPMLWL